MLDNLGETLNNHQSFSLKRAQDSLQNPPRGLIGMADILGFGDVSEFINFFPKTARILDCGSGYGQFAKKINFGRPDLKVVSLSPVSVKIDATQPRSWIDEVSRFPYGFFVNKNQLSTIPLTPKDVTNMQRAYDQYKVAGLNPGLPFDKNSFDVVIDSFSSVYYSNNCGEQLIKILELCRVVKPKGKVLVGPIIPSNSTDRMMALLVNSGLIVKKYIVKNTDKKTNREFPFWYSFHIEKK